MLVECAWCKKSMGEKEPLDSDAVTHGMCPQCLLASGYVTIRGVVYEVEKEGTLYVLLHGDTAYGVSIDPPVCTCPDAKYRGRVCKHIMGLAEVLAK